MPAHIGSNHAEMAVSLPHWWCTEPKPFTGDETSSALGKTLPVTSGCRMRKRMLRALQAW